MAVGTSLSKSQRGLLQASSIDPNSQWFLGTGNTTGKKQVFSWASAWLLLTQYDLWIVPGQGSVSGTAGLLPWESESRGESPLCSQK